MVNAILRKLWRQSRHYYRRHFRNLNHVYMHSGPIPHEHRDDCTFHRFERYADVPAEVREAVVTHGGQGALTTDRQELADGAIMWVAMSGDKLVSVLFTRRGHGYRNWFVPLRDNDIASFRARTYPEFRGRGVTAPPAKPGASEECEPLKGA